MSKKAQAKIWLEMDIYQNINLQQTKFVAAYLLFTLFTARSTKQGTVRGYENYRNEIKACIVRTGMIMSKPVEHSNDEDRWSSIFFTNLVCTSLHCGKEVELANVLGHDIVWQKRRK